MPILSQLGLGIFLDFENRGAGAMSQAQAQLGSIESNAASMTMKMAASAEVLNRIGHAALNAGTQILGAFRQGVEISADFEEQILEAAKTTGLQGQQFENLQDRILDLGATTRTTHGELAAIASEAGRMGLALDGTGQVAADADVRIARFTRTIDMFAQTAEQSGATAASMMSGMLTVFDAGIERTERFGDVFNKVADMTRVNAAQLAYATNYMTGFAKQVDATFPQTVALAGALQQMNLPAEIAGSSFMRLASILASTRKNIMTGTTYKEGFAMWMGLSPEEFEKQYNEDAVGLMMRFSTSLKGFTSTQQAEIMEALGVQGVRLQRVFTTIAKTEGAVDEYQKRLMAANEQFDIAIDQTGETFRQQQIIAQGLNYQLAQLYNVVRGEIIRGFRDFLEVLKPITQTVAAFIANVVQAHPAIVKMVAGIAAFAGAGLVLVGVIALVAALVLGIKIIGAMMITVGVIMAKVLLVAGAIIAVVALLAYAWRSHFGEMQEIVMQFVGRLQVLFGKIAEWTQKQWLRVKENIINPLLGIIDTLWPIAKAIGEFFANYIVSSLETMWALVKPIWEGFLWVMELVFEQAQIFFNWLETAGVIDWLVEMIDRVSIFVSRFHKWIQENEKLMFFLKIIGAIIAVAILAPIILIGAAIVAVVAIFAVLVWAISEVASAVESLWDDFVNIGDGIYDLFVQPFIDAKDFIVNLFTQAWEVIAEAAKGILVTPLNFMIGKAESSINSIISGVNMVPGVDIAQVSFERLARGGIVQSPTLAALGEAGPEAVIPLDTRGITALADALASAGGRKVEGTQVSPVQTAAAHKAVVHLTAYANITLELDGEVLLEKLMELEERDQLGDGQTVVLTGRGIG